MEICIDSLESARNAIEGGATRLEICSLLSEGGLTPTAGFLNKIKSFSSIPLFAMLRVRPGNFVYTREEMEVMLQDLKVLKDYGADGFVFGALTTDDEIDVEFCKDILSAARPLPVTFHRAFDQVNDPVKSLQILINLGFERILTSGQRDTADEGLELIQTLIQEAQDKIIVMPGSGITKENISKIKRETGAKEFHASAKKKLMTAYGTKKVEIGDSKPIIGINSTYIMVTDRDLVQEMVQIVLNNAQ
ncbi:Copper homeostasis protein cutC like protein [Eufriesea mexicana]|uniref:Copper homeostasis protein cutC homolog n=1 Tax=Eufriesea mexicana TaxID=516756 RepID=A0A310SGD9_9HYME|nr:PREDICTED: copper homeostasis protein cutC homolog [Eufriesea mexicana]OAD53259.1 Copper homeostasis protein cutC like protein [Eufriesea mexicana]